LPKAEADEVYIFDAREIEKLVRKNRRAQKKSLRAGVPLWAKGSVHANVWTIPLPPKKTPDVCAEPQDEPQDECPLALDKERMRELRKDTQDISKILYEIFAGDQARSAERKPLPQTNNLGLDGALAALLKALLARESWKKEEWEALAARFDLMPDGAIEIINERAFDAFDEPLLEEAGNLFVNAALVKRMADKE
jgi:hypothetical protein